MTVRPKKPMTEEKALAQLASLCSTAEHCTHDVEERLERWELPADAKERIIDFLLTHHFVDNERYCEAFVHDKIKYNKWGRRKIEQALRMKQMDRTIAARVLDGVPDEAYLNVLSPLLKAKWPTIQARNDYERSMKLIRFAMGRGFELHLIRLCIDNANDWEEDESD